MSSNEVYYIIFFAGAAIYGCIILLSFSRRVGPLLESRSRLADAGDTLKASMQEHQEELKQKTPELKVLIEQVVELRDTRDRLQEQYFELMRDRPEGEDGLLSDDSKIRRVDR